MFECSIPGESPPLPPRTFFGRDELIEKIVGLAENLIPVALIGAGGIGKTSVALAVLHINSPSPVLISFVASLASSVRASKTPRT